MSLSQGYVLGVVWGAGKENGMHIPETGDGVRSLVARFQLTGQLAVTPYR